MRKTWHVYNAYLAPLLLTICSLYSFIAALMGWPLTGLVWAGAGFGFLAGAVDARRR